MDNLLAKRQRAAYRGTAVPSAQEDLDGPTDADAEREFFTLFSKAGSNVVESAAILMEFAAAPHER